jgi:hypothetical protein
MTVIASGGRIIGSGSGVFDAGAGGGGGTVPGAATNLQVTKQGDSTNGNVNPTNNVITIGWTPGAAGTGGATTSQQVWRGVNGGAKAFYATVSAAATSYTDTAATGAYYANNIGEQGNTPPFDNGTGPTNVYDYDVYGINAAGMSAPTTDCQFWWYQGGTLLAYSAGADLSGPNTANYSDTSLSPPTGTADIALTLAGANGFLQAPSWSPGTWIYGMEGGAFNYINFKVKPTVSAAQFLLSFHSRGTPGDIGPPFITLDISNYGPTPTSGVWGTYKVPLGPLGFGIATFTGSISGGTMTASGWSGCAMDSGGWIAWSGQTTPTQIQTTPSNTGNGTYGVAGTTSQSSIAMTYHRSNFYKINIKRNGGSAGEVFGVTDVYLSRV